MEELAESDWSVVLQKKKEREDQGEVYRQQCFMQDQNVACRWTCA